MTTHLPGADPTEAAPAPEAPVDAIAVVGMAGRFPGAGDVGAFWANLLAGVDSVTDTPGAGPRGVLADAELFDAGFFGFSPLEAERTDPQHRVFLECVHAALDDAGHGDPARRPVTGLYAGSGLSTYLLDVLASPRHTADLDESQLVIGCDKDYLATRVAHRLDLRGPAVVVQSACSTSLVAVHLAVQALLAGECDLAVAGGVSVRGGSASALPSRGDGMVSPDGRCRAFDAGATGMVSGDGVGAVVLRRLDDALADGDRVLALVRGSAVNNDGAAKAGYTAPSVGGQVEVIRAAHAAAGTDPATVGYVEAHGTGTRLGDPIEVAALAEALGPGRDCVLGSVKTNIGHLDAAAGVASLIKAVQAVRTRVVPATLHFRTANPELGLADTRFRVSAEPRPWSGRAGVSSFGIGGTNAHVVLEEAPAHPAPDAHRPWQLIPLSARTPEALTDAAARLADALAPLTGGEFADAAHTLQTGRQVFGHRLAVAARTGAEAADRLRTAAHSTVEGVSPVVFLFSGQGSQYPGMGSGLRETEPVFRAEFDACLGIAADLGTDLSAALADPELLRRTEFTQPALFAVEYALARLWESWGVRPAAVVGHSVGELVAACVAGVLTREDALALVVARGRAIAACPPGAMLAVGADDLGTLPPGVEVAAVNGTAQTTVAGPADAVAAFAEDCAARGVRTRLLRTSHAFHTSAMAPAAAEVAAVAATLAHAPARIPLHSTVTGEPMTEVDPGYWGRQLRAPVRFADAVAPVRGLPMVEVGPGRSLSELAGPGARQSLPTAGADRHDAATLVETAAALWCAGVPLDWSGLHRGQRRRRTGLPGYAFQRTRHTVRGDAAPTQVIRRAPRETAPQEASPESAPRETAQREPGTGTEQVVAAVWERLLGVEGVTRDQSFFQLGGHSLVGMRVLDELAAKFGVRLPVAALYDHPTLGELAGAVDRAEATDLPPITAGPVDGAPLTPTQERFWLRQRAVPEDVAGTVFVAVRLRGRLDRAALERACAALPARHAVLRARFVDTPDGLRQVVPAAAELPLRSRTASTPAELEDLARAEAERPFDLTAESPVRALLVSLPDDEHALMLSVHHIATDAASNAVLLHDLAACYAAEARGERPELPEPDLQFADYARWLRARLADGEQERAEAHWRASLDGVSTAVQLPVDRPAGRTIHSGRLTHRTADLGALDAYRARTGAPLFACLLGAFQVLLSRYGAGERFVVGVPVTGRRLPELESVVGPLFATVPLVADLSGAPGFAEVAERVRHTAAAAFEHAAVPAERFLSGPYDVLFALQDTPAPPPDLPGLGVEPLELGRGTAQCALTLSLVRDGGGLTVLVDYDTARFDRATVEALLAHYERLLHTLPDSTAPVDRVPLLSDSERAAILESLSDHAELPWTTETVHALVAAQVERTPDATAVVFGDEELTYAELWRRVLAEARGLVSAGVRRGEVVAVCLPRSAELVVALLAVLTAGAAFLPLDPAHPADRRRRMLADSGATRLIGSDPDLTGVDQHRPGAGADGVALPGVGAGDLAYLMYTSGSTGAPKGVAVAHTGVSADLDWRRAVTGLGPGDRLLHTVSFAFDPSVWQLFGPLVTGAAVVVADQETTADATAVVELVAARGITVADFVPAQLGRALEVADGRLRTLRHVFCGGERLGADLVARFHAATTATLHNQYGPTEATIDTTSHALPRDRAETEVPIGRPVAGKRVRVLDAHGEPVPTGAVGELWIGGTGLALGYAGASGQTAARFRPDPFGEPGSRMYRSGDLARHRPDGTLEFAGRVDGQIKVNGVRIEPAEVERVLRAHSAVAEAVAVLRPVRGLPALTAYVTPSGAEPLDPAALRPFVAGRLPSAFVPAHVVALPALPLSPTGKVDVRALPEVDPGTGARAPEPGTEAALAALWAEALGLPEVAADADFFQLGGDSLVAVRLIRAVRDRFGVTVALGDFFAAATVERLAEAVEAGADTPPLRRRTTPDAPLSWSQRRVAAVAAAGGTGAEVELVVAARISGGVDEDALAGALTALVARHEALRVVVDGDRQRPVDPYDVLGNTEPLSLGTGRLLAAELSTVEGGHRLVLRAHRIAVDGAAAGVLATDLAALYRARLAGAPDPLPLRLHHPDFAAWERDRLTPGVVDAAVRDWLADTAPTPVPGALRVPPGPGGPRQVRTHVLDERQTARFAELAREHGVPARSLLLAVLADCAEAVTGPLPIAVPVSGRTDPALDGVVGRFVNLAVVRPVGAGDFADRVRRTHAEALSAYHRQQLLPHTALERVVDLPLMADLADPAPALGTGLVAEAPREHWTDFGLALQAHHTEHRLELVMLYDARIDGAAVPLAEAVFARLAALTTRDER
ncbi:non-ribosomal peptide synthetase/type I polyketide synthase [Actinokineospora spheciospongiae]|uniref:non-ribosomal peptide synthetase/type I polyketide synthase n=1 Tax=Actinokineospora spheciospongiae TaxID=909613 RepID=UPI000D7102B8|nr:non-ribosomal peptide synthetase/type I polyketide synthase [Actinokineospora spheciospongiae]PWW66627.1 amino acid adenylation domain-containing protein [Actinokineospora spheciospongiae]